MKQMESQKRIVVLLSGFIELALQTAIYAWCWFNKYYPQLSQPRVSADGFAMGNGLKLYFRGHLLVIAIYFVLLIFFSNTYGGLKIGYLKSVDVFFSQIFALIMVNLISYFQISLMNNWLVPVWPIIIVLLLELIISFVWSYISNGIYRKIFPPREMLLISGEKPINDILKKFGSRKDKYHVSKCINISSGNEAIEKECICGKYNAVILWDIATKSRNEILKFCYAHSMRVYIMPKIPDVLIKGSEQIHLFDTPIFLVREYSIKVEQRFIKRLLDIVCAFILVVITSPIMLVTAVIVKCYDGGPVLYKQIRCTLDGRQFKIMKFRSMRIDAEKDGVARLASKNDDRITPIGRFIRSCRIDELPQLFNIIAGDMSFIGPRPERPEIIEQYMEEMPEFKYRMKVKAGLAGYAQVYGKYNTTPYDKLKLDLTYIQNYSVWLDLKLALLTVKILFRPESTEGVSDSQVTAMKVEHIQENDDQGNGQ